MDSIIHAGVELSRHDISEISLNKFIKNTVTVSISPYSKVRIKTLDEFFSTENEASNHFHKVFDFFCRKY
jgi:hypothetical protein